MPSPRPQRQISAHAFPPAARRSADLPPRARQLIELMVWEGITRDEAAARMGIARDTGRRYHDKPGARRYFMALLDELRDSERARNFHSAKGIRDDGEMKKSAAGGRVRIEAMRYMDGETAGGVTVNVGVTTNIQPGYVVDVGEHAATAPAILRQARSSDSILDLEAEPDRPAEGKATRAPTSATPLADRPHEGLPPSRVFQQDEENLGSGHFAVVTLGNRR